jgi:hypothetical protein
MDFKMTMSAEIEATSPCVLEGNGYNHFLNDLHAIKERKITALYGKILDFVRL